MNYQGTNVSDPAVPFTDNGRISHYASHSDHDKPVASVAARNALKVNPDGKLNAYNPNSSGQLGLGMTVAYPDGSKEMLKVDMAWWNAAGRTEAQKVAGLQTTLTAYDPAQPGKCWWEAVTASALTPTQEVALGYTRVIGDAADNNTIFGNPSDGSEITGGTYGFISVSVDSVISAGTGGLIMGGSLNEIMGGSLGRIFSGDENTIQGGNSNTILSSTGCIIPASCSNVTLLNCNSFIPPESTTNKTYINNLEPGTGGGGGSGGSDLSADIVAGLQNANAPSAENPFATLSDVAAGGDVADGSITNTKLASEVKVGLLSGLLTTVKTTVVGAINELRGLITDLTSNQGTLSSLLTTVKGSLVAATNENTTLIGGAGALTAISAAFDEPVDSLAGAIVYQHEDFTGYKAAAAKNQNYRVDLKANLPTFDIGPGTIGRVYADTEANNGAYYVLPDGVTWAKNTQNATEAAKYYSAAEAINQASGYRSYDTPNGYSGGRRLFQSTNTGTPAAQAIPPLSSTNVLGPGWLEISASVATGSGPTYWSALQKSASNTQTLDQALLASEKKFTDELTFPSTTQTDYPFTYFEACRLTEVKKTDSISTVQYSVNGGSFTSLTFASGTSTFTLNIAAGTQVTWRVMFNNGAVSGQLQLKGTLN